MVREVVEMDAAWSRELVAEDASVGLLDGIAIALEVECGDTMGCERCWCVVVGGHES